MAELAPALAPAPAPAPIPQGTWQTQVRFKSNAPTRRREWGLATVSFPEGVWTAGKQFGCPTAPSELIPFGARWPDGSVRFAQAAIRTNLAAQEERTFLIREHTPNNPAFRYSAWVNSRLPGFDIGLVVGMPDGSVRQAPLTRLREVESTDVRRTTHYRDRFPGTGLSYDLWLTFFHDQDTAHFELRLTSSDPRKQDWIEDIGWFAITPTNCLPAVRGAFREQMTVDAGRADGVNPAVLLGPTSFYNGQSYEWYGQLLFYDGSVQVADPGRRTDSLVAAWLESLWGVATNWTETGAYGPFGYVPEPPPWITDGGRQDAIDERQEFLGYYYDRGQIWEDRPMGLYPAAGTTGSQYDFGVGKLFEILRSATPLGIEAARYAAGEESHRPVHHLEIDGSGVQARNHPNWVALYGRTHWSAQVSPDRLGKPYPEPSPTGHTNGWTGKDHEHWSSNTLCAAYMLTRSFSLEQEIATEIELYLSSHTVPSEKPGSQSNNVGNPRATGRTLLTMSWMYLMTGRQDLATRMQKRIEEVNIAQHIGLLAGGAVMPMKINRPDARAVTSGYYWVPWEESQAVLGLEACHRVTGSPQARFLAYVVTKNLIDHGWRLDFDNSLIGYAMRYREGGLALPQHWLNNPEHVRWPTSTFFRVWALPSTQIAIEYANQYNDASLLSRSLQVLRATETERQPPRSGGGWDEYASWVIAD